MNICIVMVTYDINNWRPIANAANLLEHNFYVFDVESKINNARNAAPSNNIHYVTADFSDVNKLAETVAPFKPDIIISFAELGLRHAAMLREIFGLKGPGLGDEMLTIDKHEMRLTLRDAGLTNVQFRRCNLEDLDKVADEFPMPFICKPHDLSGSIAVQLINNKEEINNYKERFLDNKYTRDSRILVEQYVAGQEYSVEGMVINGVMHIYGVTEKRTSEYPYFVERGHSFQSNHPLVNEIKLNLKKILSALKMNFCPFHIEFKMVDGKMEIIECHSRFGGDFITDLIAYAGHDVFLEYFKSVIQGSIYVSPQQASSEVYSIQFVLSEDGIITEFSIDDSIKSSSAVIELSLQKEIGDLVKSETAKYNRLAKCLFKSISLSEANSFACRFDNSYSLILSDEE